MTKKPAAKAPEGNGITEEAFAHWRLSPGTKAFCKFLEDFAEVLERDHIARWRAGKIDPDYEAEARGRVNALREMATLRFEHILEFYAEPEKDDGRDAREDSD